MRLPPLRSSAGRSAEFRPSVAESSLVRCKMKMTAILITCLTAGLANACGDDNHRINEVVKQLRGLEDVHKSKGAYRLLFATAGVDGLSRLQTVDDDSIAIQSAWETVTLTVPVEKGDRFYRPDTQKLSWFLGFLQGRARVSPPDWWRESLLDCASESPRQHSQRYTEISPISSGCYRLGELSKKCFGGKELQLGHLSCRRGQSHNS